MLKAQWRPTKILIEEKVSGAQLIQELKQEGVDAVQGVNPEGE